MKFIETSLVGAYIIEHSSQKDERGLFSRVYCRNEFSQIGHTKEFVQFNHSSNIKKGTLRGLHFQEKPHSEIKLIRCIAGSVFDVMVDLRENSPTFLKWFGTILSAGNMNSVYIPDGFAHGFQTLEDNAELLYHHTEFYTPSHESGLNPLDKKIGVQWPIEPIIYSKKDKELPFVNEFLKGI